MICFRFLLTSLNAVFIVIYSILGLGLHYLKKSDSSDWDSSSASASKALLNSNSNLAILAWLVSIIFDI